MMPRSPESNRGHFYTPASPELNRELLGILFTILIKSQIFLYIHKMFLSYIKRKKLCLLLIFSSCLFNYYPPFPGQIKSPCFQVPKKAGPGQFGAGRLKNIN